MVLVVFYYSLDPAYVENITQQRIAVKNRILKLVEDVVSTTTIRIEIINHEVDANYDSKKEVTKNKEILWKRNYPTSIPSYILQELALTNPGELGKPVVLGNVSSQIQELIKKGWAQHEFNEFVSDLVSVRRSLPDPREEYCLQKNLYLEKLPSTSVIIIFHNEAWSTLLRSVHSVLDHSPEHLIEEVLLVDDFSDLGEIFKFFIFFLSILKIF